MPKEQQDILEILRTELEFIEKGGYKAFEGQETQPVSTIFAESAICLNYGYPYRVHPCGECPLMEFVPEENRVSAMPCHHIPLDASGGTVEKMEQAGDPSIMQEAVKTWLQQTIKKLESQQPV